MYNNGCQSVKQTRSINGTNSGAFTQYRLCFVLDQFNPSNWISVMELRDCVVEDTPWIIAASNNFVMEVRDVFCGQLWRG